MMEATSTHIKFSPGRELYPGTNDRVCVIVGAIPDICACLRRIFATIASSKRADEMQDLLHHLKMLVSNISSGMIIGKSGSTIKKIQLECGVKIQISNKDENRLPERTLSIVGDQDSIFQAVWLILEHTVDDPDQGKWRKLLSYTSYSVSPTTSASSILNTTPAITSHPPAVSPHTGGSGLIRKNSMPDTSSVFLSLLHQQQQQQQQQHSLPQAFTAPSYNASAASMTSGSTLNQALLSYAYGQSLMTSSSYYGSYNPVIVDGVNLMIPGATIANYEIAIPEVMTAALFGSGGKLITDLMQSTGARIALSQKGDYIPGTYNRKLTVSGPILSVQAVHMIVLQNILKEQDAYQKQGLV